VLELPTPSVVLAFEGLSGVGKSTLVEGLKQLFPDPNPVRIIHDDDHPPEGASGALVDLYYLGSALRAQKFMARHALCGHVIIIDRYLATMYAYSQPESREMMARAIQWLAPPDAMVYLKSDDWEPKEEDGEAISARYDEYFRGSEVPVVVVPVYPNAQTVYAELAQVFSGS